MTVNNSGSQLTTYQSISYSSFRINVSSATSQATPSPASSASQATDTVSLSPEATAQATASSTDTSSTQKPQAAQTTTVVAQATQISATYFSATSSTVSTSGAAKDDAASALFNALDADQDGSVTEDEFKAGAKALLRQGQRGDHAEGVPHGDHGHRGGRRLDRALGRLFDAVDGNGDGNITKDELSAALAKTSKSAQNTQGTVQAPPPETVSPIADPTDTPTNANATSSASFVSVTVVSVAIRSYTSISQSGTTSSTSPQSPAATKPADPQTLPLAA